MKIAIFGFVFGIVKLLRTDYLIILNRIENKFLQNWE